MTALLALLAACSVEPPFVSAVSPAEVVAGDTVTLSGQHLTDGYTYRLADKPLEGLVVTDPSTATATVPGGLPPGAVDLIITGQGVDLTIGGLVSIKPPVPINPCDPSVRRMTHIPSAADVVKIDLYRGEAVEHRQFPTSDIERIEYEARVTDGAYCASIWLKTKGERVLFDADRGGPLRSQAQKIANGLGKPIEVVHEDELPQPAAGDEE